MLKEIKPEPPEFRTLRAFAYDPSLTVQFATSSLNEVEIEIPWNYDDDGLPKSVVQDGVWVRGGLSIGPENEYIKVVDFDQASGLIYEPIDLNHPAYVYSSGLSPSEKNPQFHQQMVFAVAMKTIRHFEDALGRKAFWAPQVDRNVYGDIKADTKRFSVQLRLYPHGIRDDNAFYSPSTTAIQFGYFTATNDVPAATTETKPAEDFDPDVNPIGQQLPRVGMVYTCLSYGIIAHETTHALLDGVHPGFNYRTNKDVDAFHEAFADLIALFQHFTFPKLIRHQIAQTQGDLRKHNMLGMLAYDFGKATGRPGALRDALGTMRGNKWYPKRADPTELGRTFESHARGAILVAAVFDAFRTIYESRVRDLLRIATGGTGKLPDGDIHPDLVNRMASEATTTARHFLNLCIRALDYCPPVDINFGDYMRAMITGDYDYYKTDERKYRTAITESFRKYGVYPRDVRSLLVDGLLWLPPSEIIKSKWTDMVNSVGREYQDEPNTYGEDKMRAELIGDMKRHCRQIWEHVRASIKSGENDFETAKYWSRCLFLALDPDSLNAYKSVRRRGQYPIFECQSVRMTQRVDEDSQVSGHAIIQIVQNRMGYLDPAIQTAVDEGKLKRAPKPDFIFPGGCTIIFDRKKAEPKYVIAKSIYSERRLKEVREFVAQEKEKTTIQGSLKDTFFGIAQRKLQAAEPFALLHNMTEEPEAEPWK